MLACLSVTKDELFGTAVSSDDAAKAARIVAHACSTT
jgi:hypothetical protein